MQTGEFVFANSLFLCYFNINRMEYGGYENDKINYARMQWKNGTSNQ